MKNLFTILPNKIDKSILITPEKPFFSLIWLHGLGDSPAGFLDYFQQKDSPVHRGGRVKLLHAPIRAVTINGGAKYSSWYDIRNLSGQGTQSQRLNLQEVKDSLSIIDQHIKDQITFWKQNGIQDSEDLICKRIFLGGFSQGCAMSLCFGLTSKYILGGIIGFSGHLIESFELRNKGKVPLLIYHGGQDEVLNYKWVKPSYQKHLKPLSNFTFKYIPNLPHTVGMFQLTQLTQFIQKQLQSNSIKP